MRIVKAVLFYFYAVFHFGMFLPDKCYCLNREKCHYWNCMYHYVNGRVYGNCQKGDDDE